MSKRVGWDPARVPARRQSPGRRPGLRRSATALHLHVNTVAQRLERVGSLLGEDWQHPEHALELQLAVRLRRLMRAG